MASKEVLREICRKACKKPLQRQRKRARFGALSSLFEANAIRFCLLALDASGFAGELAHVGDLVAADFAPFHDLDLGD